ncbi:hypothetical protein I4X03_014325 [Massilia sp. R798]|uniref:Uncharacterized protein n=2 Tax=Massilia soli TaxID=2792854 RepID=A0ABS7SR70_9BURK|nr:hypothetical protein [Massilia soli]MBZ2208438.1 hypothetical protein [Massilia soli]
MSCDRIGNLLLVKFLPVAGKETCIFVPASIVFWLLKHLPVNQDPQLTAPAVVPRVEQYDWDNPNTPRALTVQCKQFSNAIRMQFALERGPDLMVLLDRSNVELMRQMMVAYSKDLIDLDAE